MPNANVITWGINFRPLYPKAEKEWDGVVFYVQEFDKANPATATVNIADTWSNSGMLPVLNTSGLGFSQLEEDDKVHWKLDDDAKVKCNETTCFFEGSAYRKFRTESMGDWQLMANFLQEFEVSTWWSVTKPVKTTSGINTISYPL